MEQGQGASWIDKARGCGGCLLELVEDQTGELDWKRVDVAMADDFPAARCGWILHFDGPWKAAVEPGKPDMRARHGGHPHADHVLERAQGKSPA